MTSAGARAHLEAVASSFLAARLKLARLAVSDADRLERILEHATRLSAEQLDVERVGIWLFDETSSTLTLCLLFELSKGQHSRPGSSLATESTPAYFRALEEMRALAIEDARSNAATAALSQAYLEPLGIGSLLDAPIFRQGKLFGIVCHEHVGPPRAWSSREVDFAIGVADMVALYFEQAEAVHAQRQLLTQEKGLMQAERLASVGLLARHVAHDFNNAITPILMCAAQLRTALQHDERLSTRVNIILNAAEHGVAIAKRLLRAAAGGPATIRGAIDFDALLLDATPLLRAVAGDEIHLVVEAGAGHGLVRADPMELMRALINLVTNGRDAMPGGGRITLKTVADGAWLRLTVADGGQGMTDEAKANLFQPFFTTKPGHGSGLGLAGVRGTVDALQGTVEVHSAPGEGTTVVIALPLVSRPPEEELPEEEPPLEGSASAPVSSEPGAKP